MSATNRSRSGIVLLAISLVLTFATQGFKLRDPITPANDLRPDQLGPYRHWDLREFQFCKVPYAVANNCRDVANVVPSCDAAAATWTAVLPSRLFLNNVGTADSVLGGDNKNSLFWDNSNMTGLYTIGDGTIAITVPTYQAGAAGRLSECDIVFNDMEFLWTTTLGDSLAGTRVFTGTTAPWDFDSDNDGTIDHNVLNLTIHGTQNRVVTFVAADFADINAATRQEVRDAINAAAGNFVAGHRVLANSFANNTISVEDDPQLPIGTATGEISMRVTGGSANTVLAFPTGKVTGGLRVDVQTICLHEMGHFIGLAHTAPNTVPVMYNFAPNTGTKRVLTADDMAGCSYLYSPDLGDADDTPYPTLVYGTANGRTLNGMTLKVPAQGALHMNGLDPSFQYVKLGATKTAECLPNISDADMGDDGVNVIPPPSLPGNYTVQVTMTVAPDDSGRSLPCTGFDDKRYYLNGWFDWNNNGTWEEPAEHMVGFSSCATANNQYIFTPAEHGNTRTFWARFRVDYAEDAGAVRNINGDLDNVRGVAQYGEVEDYLFDFNIVPVQLESFRAVDLGAGAVVSWRATATPDVAGYHVLRAVDGAEPEQVTSQPILVTGPAGHPQDYEWRDPASPQTGEVDYYLLEMGRDGTTGSRLGPVQLSRKPLVAALGTPYPNPFSFSTTIEYTIDARRQAVLQVFDLGGRLVRTLASGTLERGTGRVEWNGKDQNGNPAAAGIYYMKLTLDDGWSTTRKVVLSR